MGKVVIGEVDNYMSKRERVLRVAWRIMYIEALSIWRP